MEADFNIFWNKVLSLQETEPKLVLVYVVVYLLWGIGMNEFGKATKIARFKYWWQIITCYIVYMIPISLLLKDLAWYDQYCYGLFFMGLLEFGGYTIKSSIAYDNNILDKLFTRTNFSLGMTLFFATYFPIGNWAVEQVYNWVF